jgi:hypothetical protein
MTRITWFARLVTADGTPAAGIAVQLQMFDLAAGWKGISDATTGDDGAVRGTAGEAGPANGAAPMLRLAETDSKPAVLGGVPNVGVSGSPPALACDFGEIVHMPDRFTVARAAPTRFARSTPVVAGVAMPVAAARMGVASALAGATLVRASTTDTIDVQASLAERDADVIKVRAERDDVATRLAERTADIDRLRVERDDVKARLVDAEKRLADIRVASPINPAGAGDAKVSLGDFATRLGGEIDSAQTALKDRGFSLGTISVTARALVDDGGSRISFPAREDMKSVNVGTLSDIALQYHPSPVGDAAGTGVQVPDVRQLTESAARRVLASVGLGLEVTQGPPAIDPTCAEGQVMLQAPRAGERAARGTRVIAIFARSAQT